MAALAVDSEAGFTLAPACLPSSGLFRYMKLTVSSYWLVKGASIKSHTELCVPDNSKRNLSSSMNFINEDLVEVMHWVQTIFLNMQNQLLSNRQMCHMNLLWECCFGFSERQ